MPPLDARKVAALLLLSRLASRLYAASLEELHEDTIKWESWAIVQRAYGALAVELTGKSAADLEYRAITERRSL